MLDGGGVNALTIVCVGTLNDAEILFSFCLNR